MSGRNIGEYTARTKRGRSTRSRRRTCRRWPMTAAPIAQR